jgi:hypothetical protein
MIGGTKAARGVEIQFTDALPLLAKESGFLTYVYERESYDARDKLGFLKADAEIALENQELGSAFRDNLRSLKLKSDISDLAGTKSTRTACRFKSSSAITDLPLLLAPARFFPLVEYILPRRGGARSNLDCIRARFLLVAG